MPFNFPIEQNRFGDLFAQGISNAINTYQQGKQLQRQKTLTELQNPGFHFGQMPTVDQYSRRLPNATTEPVSVDNSVMLPGQDTIRPSSISSPQPSATPLHISSPSVSVSQPNQFQSTISNALASMPKGQRNAPASSVDSSYIPLSGGYLNTNEMMQRLLPQMMLNARGKFFESQAEASGKAAGDPSEVGLRTAQTNLAQRNAGEVRNQDAGYVPLLANVAAAQANAKVPAAIATAGGVANATLGTKEALQKNQSDLEFNNQSRLIPLRVKAELASPMYGLAAGKAFENQTAGLTAGIPLYGQAKTAIAQARGNNGKPPNPAAFESALLNFATSADPKGQLRQGLVKMETRINPSFAGNVEQAAHALATGALRPQDLDNMESLIDQNHETNKALYKQRRDAYVKANPAAEPIIQDPDVVFNVPGVSSRATPKGPYDDLK